MAKNTKAKIRRVAKNHKHIDPNAPKVPKLQDFQTRKEYNRWKQEVRNYTDRKNENFQYETNRYGVTMTKAEKKRIVRNTKKAQREAKQKIKEFKELPLYQRGKEVKGGVSGRMDMMGERQVLGFGEVPDFNFDNVQSRRRLEQLDETRQEMARGDYYPRRMRIYQDNFIRSVEGSFNSEADEVIAQLKSLPPDAFFEMSMMFTEMQFDVYDSEGQFVDANEDHLNMIMSYIEQYKKGDLDFRLSNF